MEDQSELEWLEAIVATQDLIHSEVIDVSEYLGKDQKDLRHEKPVTNAEIRRGEKERVPVRTRKNTAWAVRVYQAWSQHRNARIETLDGEYSSDPLSFEMTSVEEVDYWLTRFILETRRANGNPYPVNTLYNISTGLLRHFSWGYKKVWLEHSVKKQSGLFII